MKKIIFVCAENAGRSQMAEAFFNTLAAGTDLMAESAGTIPAQAQAVNPVVVAAMQEKGIDISAKFPKRFKLETAGEYERLISFGCLVKSAFPSDIQVRIEDWEVDDPKEKTIEAVRRVRDVIEVRVKELLASLQK